MSAADTTSGPGVPFDLNIEKVLEHWPVSNAVRELIANALDEHHLTDTPEPTISKDPDGTWVITDFGRGLRFTHLTQKENSEKRKHPHVIGQFGIGLKDAVAVFDRRHISVTIRSQHGDITFAERPKEGFASVRTLHALVAPPSDPHRTGTRIELVGLKDSDVDSAKSCFLLYSGDTLLEATAAGAVLARPATTKTARIYVKGLLVAEEDNFLFSYNITKLSAPLRRALNRERTNVGRGAYTPTVKDILKASRATEVVAPMTEDLGRYAAGAMHDELHWKDVALHACRVLQTLEKVIFIDAFQVRLPNVQYAENDGYRPVVVPGDIANALGKMTDLDGNQMRNLDAYTQEFNDSFTYTFIPPDELNDKERAVYALTDQLCALAGIPKTRYQVRDILISETMRLGAGEGQILGVYEEHAHRIVIRRDQLRRAQDYAGTLLHEFSHAASGEDDGTLEFESELTKRLGITLTNATKTHR